MEVLVLGGIVVLGLDDAATFREIVDFGGIVVLAGIVDFGGIVDFEVPALALRKSVEMVFLGKGSGFAGIIIGSEFVFPISPRAFLFDGTI